MTKRVDLRTHKPQIADRYIVGSKVMVRYGTKTGGWVRIRNLSDKTVTILRVNRKSLTVALRTGARVSVFNIVTRGSFKVLPIIAEKIHD